MFVHSTTFNKKKKKVLTTKLINAVILLLMLINEMATETWLQIFSTDIRHSRAVHEHSSCAITLT